MNATPQRGFSLVELMVASALTLLSLAALFNLGRAVWMAQSTGAALSQMAEDGMVTLALLRGFIAQAGYSTPIAAEASGTLRRTWALRAVFGCDAEFSQPSAPIQSLTCGKKGLDALAVAFQADAHNSLLGSDGLPMDCAGNQIAPTAGPGGVPFHLSYNRFYVVDGTLYCKGSGGTGQAMALLDHVQTLDIHYGLAASVPDQVAAYVPAADVLNWGQVVAVRLCLVVRSASDGMVPEPVPYVGCDPFAASITPVDRRLYRAYTLTVMLRNARGTAA